MADTTFVSKVTNIVVAWTQALNDLVYKGRNPNFATTTGTANAQILTLATGSLYTTESDGDEFWFKAGFTNTAATTLQIIPPSGTNTARAVQFDGVALAGGEIQSGVFYKVVRIGTTWQLHKSKQVLFTGPTAQRTLTLPDANLTLPAVTTAGDTLVASASGVLARLGVGSQGQSIIADSSQFSTNKLGWGVPLLRSYLAGATLSTAGASATMTVAAGQGADSTNVAMLSLASATGKTTAAWAVGTGNGGLDTGAIANSTWYHFYLITRVDTGVVDVLFSTSASAPTMPANYTLKRRIGSGLTNGSGQWTSFTQDGDYFIWAATVLDINANNPGTSAVLRTLSVPLGVNVEAHVQAGVQNTAAGGITGGYFSDPAQNDETPIHGAGTSLTDTPEVWTGAGAVRYAFSRMRVRTNTSSQIRSRLVFSDASCYVVLRTLGWWDTRGRNA